MSNPSPREARAQWAERLVTFYFVDLDLLAQSLSDALPQSGVQITAQTIKALMLGIIDGAPQSGWHQVISTKNFIGVPLFMRSYSKWAIALGMALGFNCDDLDFEDDWVESSTAEVQAILLGLTDRLRADYATAKKIDHPTARTRAFKAMQISTTAGESPQQIKVRADRAANGLRIIK
jgi:hypothetical protein